MLAYDHIRPFHCYLKFWLVFCNRLPVIQNQLKRFDTSIVEHCIYRLTNLRWGWLLYFCGALNWIRFPAGDRTPYLGYTA